MGYLGLYNLAFVLPLLIFLVGVGNRRVMHRIRVVEQSSRRWVRLATGLGMVAVGAVILVWFATNDPTQPWVEVRITADVQP